MPTTADAGVVVDSTHRADDERCRFCNGNPGIICAHCAQPADYEALNSLPFPAREALLLPVYEVLSERLAEGGVADDVVQLQLRLLKEVGYEVRRTGYTPEQIARFGGEVDRELVRKVMQGRKERDWDAEPTLYDPDTGVHEA